MLENFTETFIPDNRFKCLCDCNMPGDLTIGATVAHTFSFPFDFANYVRECSIIYREGLNIILEKNFTTEDLIANDFHIQEKDLDVYLSNRETRSDIVLTLNIEDTEKFRIPKYQYLDTKVQVKIFTVDDGEYYNTSNKLILKRPLPIMDYENKEEEEVIL